MIDGIQRAEVGSSGLEKMDSMVLRQVCAEFESLLINYIMKAGRQTLPGNGIFDHSNESKIYQSMMDEKLAISVARSKGMGLGELMYRQLTKTSAGQHNMSQFV